MLMQLTRVMRVKAARILAALYAFCLVAPIAGFAFAGSALAAHCLDLPKAVIQVQHFGEAQASPHHAHHGHGDVATIDHAGVNNHAGADHAKSKTVVPACCGAMCVTALPANLFELLPRTVYHMLDVDVADAGIAGEAPDRLYRPPILLLSL